MQPFAAVAVCAPEQSCAAAQRVHPFCATAHLRPFACHWAQSLYADLSGNVLLHASVPALGLRAEQWAIVSWGHAHAQLPDFADARFTYRCARRAVLLRVVGFQIARAPAQWNPETIRRRALARALHGLVPAAACCCWR